MRHDAVNGFLARVIPCPNEGVVRLQGPRGDVKPRHRALMSARTMDCSVDSGDGGYLRCPVRRDSSLRGLMLVICRRTVGVYCDEMTKLTRAAIIVTAICAVLI